MEIPYNYGALYGKYVHYLEDHEPSTRSWNTFMNREADVVPDGVALSEEFYVI